MADEQDPTPDDVAEGAQAEQPAAQAGEQAAKPARRRRAKKAERVAASGEQEPGATEDAGAKAAKPQKPARHPRKAAEPEPVAEGTTAQADAPAKAARKRPAPKAAAEQPAEAPVEAPRRRPARETPAPARRRVVRARARYVRTSARKARLVCGHIRGKSVGEARAILEFTPRDVARDWSKLLDSAVANAESNHELLEEDLIVRDAFADEGPTIKRFRPRAMGRATPIRKRTSHLTIALVARPEPPAKKKDR
jgi:ribosomal protein L22